MKESELTAEDRVEIDMRVVYAKKWLNGYADEKFIFALQDTLPEAAAAITTEQKSALVLFADKLEGVDSTDGQAIHALTHDIKEESGLSPKEFFTALYLAFLGKESGPKVGWFLSTLDKDFVLTRLREA